MFDKTPSRLYLPSVCNLPLKKKKKKWAEDAVEVQRKDVITSGKVQKRQRTFWDATTHVEFSGAHSKSTALLCSVGQGSRHHLLHLRNILAAAMFLYVDSSLYLDLCMSCKIIWKNNLYSQRRAHSCYKYVTVTVFLLRQWQLDKTGEAKGYPAANGHSRR